VNDSPSSPLPAPPSPAAARGAASPRAPWAAFRGAEFVLIFGATLAAYLPAIRGGFIWNDRDYVTQPALQPLAGLGRIWFQVGATQQYYPLLHSAFWVEHRLWGDAPLGYHLLNVLLHATSACLFVLLLRRLRIPGAVLGGLIFALHPVCVESVAWVSEQKNTLSTVFYLLAALAYFRWRESAARESAVGTGGPPVRAAAGSNADTDGRAARPHLYWVATGLFLLAALSKSVAATLPAALLVILWWRQGRLDWRRDVGPLLPWFALGAATGLFTAWVEHTFIGAKGDAFGLTLVQRSLVAGRAVWFYLGKLIWPARLIFIYPRWTIDAAAAGQYLYPLAALGALAGLWAWRGRSRAPLAAALLFVGTLFPTLGFFNVFAFIFSFVADHFQYLAALSVIALAAGAWGRWAAASSAGTVAFSGQGFPPAAVLPRLGAVALLAVLGTLTWRQSRMYKDVIAFYRTTLEQNPGSWMGHHNLGVTLAEAGQLPEAVAEYEAALRIKPDDALAEYDLGNALAKLGRTGPALEHYRRALRLEPNYVKANFAIGTLLAQAGRIPEAIGHYQNALRFDPAFAEARYELGNAFLATGRVAEAAGEFQQAVQFQPDNEPALSHLGAALVQGGRNDLAIGCLTQALRLRPDDGDAHYNLGIALAQSDRIAEALAQFEEAARLQPADPDAQVNLALALAQVGRVPEAIAHCRAALRFHPDFAPARELLGRLAPGR
jgi:tetratricopeptide (TPR) repeat protein